MRACCITIKMGVCLSQYRIAIGYVNQCKFVTLGFSVGIRGNTVNLLFIFIVVCILNIQAGDIELNPGPVKYKNIRVDHMNICSLSRSNLSAIKTSLVSLYIITVLGLLLQNLMQVSKIEFYSFRRLS